MDLKLLFLELTPCPALAARVIDVSHGKIDVAESCLEETGGLGVDIVLDAGGTPGGVPGSLGISCASFHRAPVPPTSGNIS